MRVSTSNGSRTAGDPWFLSGLWDKGRPTLQLTNCLGATRLVLEAALGQSADVPAGHCTRAEQITDEAYEGESHKQSGFALATCLRDRSSTSRLVAYNRYASNPWSWISAVSSSSNLKQRHTPSNTNWPCPAAGSACSSLERRLTSRNVNTTALATTNYTLGRRMPSTPLWILSRKRVSPLYTGSATTNYDTRPRPVPARRRRKPYLAQAQLCRPGDTQLGRTSKHHCPLHRDLCHLLCSSARTLLDIPDPWRR
jgi:hypothetical protein